jgi:hypothetical protein
MKNKTIGYGFVGRWYNGSVGWCMPRHLSQSSVRGRSEPPSDVFDENAKDGDCAVLCKITVEVVHDKLGREIRRKKKSEKAV